MDPCLHVPELIANVLSNSDRHTLRSAALVSRNFHPEAQRALWRHILIRTIDQLAHILNAISHDVQLARFIRTFDVSINTPSIAPDVISDMQHSLNNMFLLEKLVLDFTVDDRKTFINHLILPLHPTFSLRSFSCTLPYDASLHAFLYSQPEIRDLHFQFPSLYPQIIPPPTSPDLLPNLRELYAPVPLASPIIKQNSTIKFYLKADDPLWNRASSSDLLVFKYVRYLTCYSIFHGASPCSFGESCRDQLEELDLRFVDMFFYNPTFTAEFWNSFHERRTHKWICSLEGSKSLRTLRITSRIVLARQLALNSETVWPSMVHGESFIESLHARFPKLTQVLLQDDIKATGIFQSSWNLKSDRWIPTSVLKTGLRN